MGTQQDIDALAIAERRTKIADTVRQLAAKRTAKAEQDAEIAKAREQFEASIAAAVLVQKDIAAQITVLEDEVKGLAQAIYAAEPKEKQITAGVSIAISRTLKYDAAKAEEWTKAKSLFRIPEQLDTKAFESFLTKATGHDFKDYTISETPTVKLATDLNKAIATEKK